MNTGSTIGEYIRLCTRRAVLLLVMVLATFAVLLVYMLSVTDTQYVYQGSIRLVSQVSGQTIADQSDLAVLAASAANTSIGLVENSDTVGLALTATYLTDFDAAVFKTNVSAERINDSDIIQVTVIFPNDWQNAAQFTYNLLTISCDKIGSTDFGGASFTGEIVEPGSQIEVRRKFAPSLRVALFGAGGAVVLFLLIQLIALASDKTLRTREKLDKLVSVPVVAAIPSLSRVSDRSAARTTNAYRGLRSAIKYSQDKVRSVAVCSPQPRDGRTSVAIGLATALAETDAMVLLIEADMRRPNVSMEMHIESAFGLADLLLGKTNLASAICKTSNRNLYVITAVNNTNLNNINISDLLDSVVFDELLEAVQAQFDYVIIDTPPLEGYADSTSIVGKTDCALNVAKYGHTRADAIKASMDVFTASGGQMIGVVTTNTPTPTSLFEMLRPNRKPSRSKRSGSSSASDIFNMSDAPRQKSKNKPL